MVPMQCVILAAGRGTRMGKLTDNRPKPLLAVGGKDLIERKLGVLPAEIDEVIMIVGYLREMIESRFGESFGGRKMRYAVQENIVGGTADALWAAKDLLHDRFLILNGDDLYAAEDLAAMIAGEGWSVLGQKAEGPKSGGKLVVDDAGLVIDIAEGTHPGTLLLNTNAFALDTRLFGVEPVPKAPGSREMGLPQTVLWATKALGIPLRAVEATRWVQITAPEDLETAEKELETAVS